MGLFDKIFAKKAAVPDAITAQTAQLTVCAPFSGQSMRLENIPDPVFSQEILGPGCGMEPSEETVYAPFDGTVSQLTDTKHAVGVTSTDGIELLIHVGMDTVDMAGKGFNCLVKEGQSIKAGQPLMTFTLTDIKVAGHPATTAVVVTNSDDFSNIELLTEGQIGHGEPLLKVRK